MSNRGPANTARATDMQCRYLAGETLAEIGAIYGISRERVRQVLAKLGMGGKDGGVHVRSEQNHARKLAAFARKRDVRAQKSYGCNRAELEDMNQGLPFTQQGTFARAYKTQRLNARKRSIPWLITLKEWKQVWVDSGHWEQRGRGTGYVMARNGDAGPYAVGNVYITSASQNTIDGYAFRKARGWKYPRHQQALAA